MNEYRTGNHWNGQTIILEGVQPADADGRRPDDRLIAFVDSGAPGGWGALVCGLLNEHERDGDRIDALIEASSLGTPDAKAMRSRTSPEAARRVVELSHQLADPAVRVVRCRFNWAAHPIDDDCQDVEDATL